MNFNLNINSDMQLEMSSQIDNTDGRTGRTYEETHYGRDILSLAVTRAGVPKYDAVSLASVIEEGFLSTGERFPVLRTGEREPISWHKRSAIYYRDQGTCRRCGMHKPKPWHLDHIIPWSANGSDHSTNLRLLCESCNVQRSNYDDKSSFARHPVTWWCHRCYLPEHRWEYGNHVRPSEFRPANNVRCFRGHKCRVEAMYLMAIDRGESPTWHERAPMETLVDNAFCAHCNLPGLTDVTL